MHGQQNIKLILLYEQHNYVELSYWFLLNLLHFSGFCFSHNQEAVVVHKKKVKEGQASRYKQWV
jgi:hypothetical protein